MTQTDPMRSKTLACLREGRVTVYGVTVDTTWSVTDVVARVLSSRDRHPYRVEYHRGIEPPWTCDCRSGRRGEDCAHVRAVALVTTEGAAA